MTGETCENGSHIQCSLVESVETKIKIIEKYRVQSCSITGQCGIRFRAFDILFFVIVNESLRLNGFHSHLIVVVRRTYAHEWTSPMATLGQIKSISESSLSFYRQ